MACGAMVKETRVGKGMKQRSPLGIEKPYHLKSEDFNRFKELVLEPRTPSIPMRIMRIGATSRAESCNYVML